MNSQNVDSYRSLKWILNDSEDGLFFLIASERMQQEIETFYQIPNIAIYNYKQHPGVYSIHTLEEWISRQSDADVYLIMNFQLAIQEEEGVIKLNFSRDVLADLKKNIVFCLTTWADDKLARNAYDFYSYIKLRIFFEDEFLEDAEVDVKEIIDKSVGVDRDIEIDFGQPKELLLSRAIAFINQAEQLCDEFRYNDALLFLADAMTIREKLLGERHQDTAAVYTKIADVYVDTYEYGKALEYYGKALSIREEMLKHEDSLHAEGLIAETYNDIGLVYQEQGEYGKALEYYNKAISIREKVYGKEHPETATTYNNIGLVYKKQGEYGKALEYYNKAMSIREKVYGKEHPTTATTYNNIGGVYQEQGEDMKAFEYYNKALVILKLKFGENHPHVEIILNNLNELKKSIPSPPN